MTPGVARRVVASFTCWTVREADSERSRAAMPATCGAAMEVPEIVFVAVSLDDHAAVTPEPGAKISVHVPKLEKLERASSPCCMALTV